MICRHQQVKYEGKKTREHKRNTQKILSCVTLTKEAHKLEQTNVPCPGTDVSKIGTHLSVTQTKAAVRGGRVGSAEPPLNLVQVHFGGKVDLIHSKAVLNVSIPKDGGNRSIRTIKGASLTPSHTHHSRLGVVPHCKGDVLVR